jgi:hypothetical protein
MATNSERFNRAFDPMTRPMAYFRRNLRGLMTAALAFSGVPARALDPDQILNYSWKDFVLRPQFDAAAAFTDNLFYGNDSVVNADGLVLRPKESDFIFTLSPGLRIQYGRMDENFVTVEYTHDQVFYLDHSEHNTHQERLELKENFEVGKLKLTGMDQISFLSSFIGGSSQTLAGKIVDRRVFMIDHRLEYELSPKVDVYLEPRYDETDFVDGTPLLDQNTLRGSVGGSYKATEKIFVFVEGFYGQTATSPNLLLQPKGPHSDIYGGYVGARGQFTPKLDGSLKVGYEIRQFPNSGAQGADSPAVDAQLNFAAGPKTSLNLRYQRNTGVSAQFSQQTYLLDYVTLSATQLIGTTGKWGVTGGLRYSRGDFSELLTVGPAISTTVPQHIDTTYDAYFSLIYQPKQWLTVTLGYDFERFDTEAEVVFSETATGNVLRRDPYLVDYDNHLVTLKVAIGY